MLRWGVRPIEVSIARDLGILDLSLDVPALCESRDRFFVLAKSQRQVKMSFKPALRSFDDKKAAILTNLFFVDFLGKDALKQLREFVYEHNTRNMAVSMDLPQVVADSESLTLDNPPPPHGILSSICQLQAAFRRVHRAEVRSNLAQLLEIIETIKAYRHWKYLSKVIGDKNEPLYGELCSWIASKKDKNGESYERYKLQRGGSWYKAFFRYLADSLDIEDTSTLSTCMSERNLVAKYHLVNIFGQGILLLIPSSFK
jgi:hypothetical protein